VRELNVFVSSSFFLARVFVFAKQIACVTVFLLKAFLSEEKGKFFGVKMGMLS
jgi:hypothetical protein